MKWSLNSYNLIVYTDTDESIFKNHSGWSSFRADRLFGYTDDDIRDRFKDNLAGLGELPTLVLGEIIDHRPIPAFLSRIYEVEKRGGAIRFGYEHLTDQLSSQEVFSCGYFEIATHPFRVNESNHTHWAVKRGNVVEALLKLLVDRVENQRPKLFNVERWPLPIGNHIAIMMPFERSFDPVYQAIQSACKNEGLESRRVDQIYTPTPVVRDIFSTIAQSRMVISDLTGRNPNVLYETGLAHALNRHVIMIAQNKADIPFDLDHIRFFPYLPNEEGFDKLKSELSAALRASEANDLH